MPKRCHFGIEVCGFSRHVVFMKAASAKSSIGSTGKKVVRVNPRFPEATAKRLKEASAIRGQSVAAFVLEAVTREAERVIEEQRVWNMSLEASEKIQRLLAKPPKINAAARKAAKDLAAHVRIRS